MTEENSADRANRSCAAYGCPLLGTVRVEGSWLCAAHAMAPPSRWQDITLALNRWSSLLHAASALMRVPALPMFDEQARQLMDLVAATGLDLQDLPQRIEGRKGIAPLVGHRLHRLILMQCEAPHSHSTSPAEVVRNDPMQTLYERIDRIITDAANTEADRMEAALAAGAHPAHAA